MAREWDAKCKDCGKPFGYSHTSVVEGQRRGYSRPERCPSCRQAHAREINAMGLAFYKIRPLHPEAVASGIRPGRLGKIEHGDRRHTEGGKPSQIEDGSYPASERFGITEERLLDMYAQLVDPDVQVMVVVGPTGSGKSTYLPYRLLNPPKADWIDPEFFTRNGQIVITQPRIQATKGIPRFVGGVMHGCSLGAGYDVGYRHSNAPNCDWKSKLVYVTDGSLINWIANGDLNKISLIMIDEAHERSLNIDIIIGLLVRLLPRYPRLKLLIASATIDHKRFIKYFDDHAAGRKRCGYIRFAGKSFGVTEHFRPEADTSIRYPTDKQKLGKIAGEIHKHLAARVIELLTAMYTRDSRFIYDHRERPVDMFEKRGDIVGFLHGKKPIDEAVKIINEEAARIDVLNYVDPTTGQRRCLVEAMPLYTDLPQEQQEKALAKPPMIHERLADDIVPVLWAMFRPGLDPVTGKPPAPAEGAQGQAKANGMSPGTPAPKSSRNLQRRAAPGHLLGVLYNRKQVRDAFVQIEEELKKLPDINQRVELLAFAPDPEASETSLAACDKSGVDRPDADKRNWPSRASVASQLRQPPAEGKIRIVICAEELVGELSNLNTTFSAENRFGMYPDVRRVVVSTNVAETSLTIHGVLHVVDSGFINESTWDPVTQTAQVPAVVHSRAGCRQRWGRAGRIQAGDAWTLYSEKEFYLPYANKEEADKYESAVSAPPGETRVDTQSIFPPFSTAEIERAPLESLVMQAKANGIDDLERFPWIDKPDATKLQVALKSLRQKGAIDAAGDLTAHGFELHQFAADVGFANLMILADRFACAVEMAAALAMIKAGGLGRLFRNEDDWDANTKDRVRRIQQALVAGAEDDLEANLKVFAAWSEAKMAEEGSPILARITGSRVWVRCWQEQLQPLLSPQLREALGADAYGEFERSAKSGVGSPEDIDALVERFGRKQDHASGGVPNDATGEEKASAVRGEHRSEGASEDSASASPPAEDKAPREGSTQFNFVRWQTEAKAAFGEAAGAAWSALHFVNNSVLVDPGQKTFDQLVDSLSGHKKEKERRKIEFGLLDRVRILFAHGLPDQSYSLAQGSGAVVPVVPLSGASEAIKLDVAGTSLFKGADDDDASGLPLPSAFVAADRKTRNRRQPGGGEVTVLSLSYIVNVPRNWIEGENVVHKMSSLGLAMFIAAQTRDPATGDLLGLDRRSRLFLEQLVPLGSRCRFHIEEAQRGGGSDGPVFGRVLAVSFPEEVEERWRSVKADEKDEADPAEGLGTELADLPGEQIPVQADTLSPEHADAVDEIDDLAGADADRREDVATLRAEEVASLGSHDPIDALLAAQRESADRPSDAPSDAANAEAAGKDGGGGEEWVTLASPLGGFLLAIDADNLKPGQIVVGEVEGFDLAPPAAPTVRLSQRSREESFSAFAAAWKVGDELNVTVRGHSRTPGTNRVTLAVQDPVSGLQVSMDPTDVSLSFYGDVVALIPKGSTFPARIEAIDAESRTVSLTTLHHVAELHRELESQGGLRLHPARLVTTTRRKAVLALEQGRPEKGALVVLEVDLDPPEKWPSAGDGGFQVHAVRYRNPRFSWTPLKDVPADLETLREIVGDAIEWEDARDEGRLRFWGQMDYETRNRLLGVAAADATRDAIKALFQRSNQLDGAVFDPEWQDVSGGIRVNDVITARILSIEADEETARNKGRVSLDLGKIKGTLAFADRKTEDTDEALAPGRELQVRVLAVDEVNKSVRVGRRQLDLEIGVNYPCIMAQIPPGNKGAEADLPAGVRGWCSEDDLETLRHGSIREVYQHGQMVWMKLTGYNDRGNPQLSQLAASNELLAPHLADPERVIGGRVVAASKRDAIVDLGTGLFARCNISEAACEYVESISPSLQVGETYWFRLLRSRQANCVQASRKQALHAHVRAVNRAFPQKAFRGTVKEIATRRDDGNQTGVQVDLGHGAVAFCPLRELCFHYTRFNKIEEVCGEGDPIAVTVTAKSDGSIILSAKEPVRQALKPATGSILEAKVVEVRDQEYLAVELAPRASGRCYIGQIGNTRIESLDELFAVDAPIPVMFSGIDPKEDHLLLSRRGAIEAVLASNVNKAVYIGRVRNYVQPRQGTVIKQIDVELAPVVVVRCRIEHWQSGFTTDLRQVCRPGDRIAVVVIGKSEDGRWWLCSRRLARESEARPFTLAPSATLVVGPGEELPPEPMAEVGAVRPAGVVAAKPAASPPVATVPSTPTPPDLGGSRSLAPPAAAPPRATPPAKPTARITASQPHPAPPAKPAGGSPPPRAKSGCLAIAILFGCVASMVLACVLLL